MDSIICYIFDSLQLSEKNMSIVTKLLRKQKSFNRTVSILALISTLHIVAQRVEICDIHRKIKNLETEIKEPKKTR